MAYDNKKITAQALAAIEKHKLFFMEDVIAYLPCSRAHFYAHKLDKIDAIKDALSAQKTNIKVGIRAKLYNDTSATGLIALYKLIGTEDEVDRLNGRPMAGLNLDLSDKGELTLVVKGSRSNLLDPEGI